MIKLSIKTKSISFLSLICLLAALCVFYCNPVFASSGTVEFGEDVILDLTGLDATIYIAAGSKADSLDISDNTLDVSGILSGTDFILKTAENNVLKLTPSGGTAGLNLSSANVSSEGYVSAWTAVSSVSVTYTIKTPDPNAYYAVKVNSADLEDSPFDSGALAEISFSLAGTGSSQNFEITVALVPTVKTLFPTNIIKEEDNSISVTLRGNLTSLGGAEEIHTWFEWGTNKENLTESTAEQLKSQTGVFRADISGLVEGTTYHFKAVAENKSGGWKSEGEIISFVAREGFFIIVEMAGKTRFIQIDREGRIIIQKEL